MRSAIVALWLVPVACGGSAQPALVASLSGTLESHARAQDDEGLRLAVDAVKSHAPSDRMRGLAALLEYEAPRLEPIDRLLEERLAHAASDDEKAMVACVLVRAGDANVVPAALGLFASGALQHPKRLDGSAALDVVAFARLVSTIPVPDELADVQRKALLAALPEADGKARGALTRALIQSGDAPSLVLAARALDAQKDAPSLEHVFEQLIGLADPRTADELARYADHATHPHFRVLAALALAEVGDLRAAPHLAWRLGEDPLKLYDRADPNAAALRADDRERVMCARQLTELALMHPEARAQLREVAEPPTVAWIESSAEPHANALRLLVSIDPPRALPLLRKLADPTAPIPTAVPIPVAFAVAQSALRYLGSTHDASAWPILEKQLHRKPASFDAATDSLAQGAVAAAGMVYRGLAIGAVDGFAEYGGRKAVPLLVKVAEDPKANETARVEACLATASLADATSQRDVVGKILAADRKHDFQRTCWLEGLAQRPAPAQSGLVSLLSSKTPPQIRHLVARVLGYGGLSADDRAKVEGLLKDPALVHDAALALLLGGDASAVAMAFAAYEPPANAVTDDAPTPPPMEPLHQLYAQSFPVLGEELVTTGALARIASLALAARAVTVRGTKQEWVLQGLAYQLRDLGKWDAGPHTLTRTTLRAKLLGDARGPDPQKRDDALLLLWLFGERASLLSLGDVAKPRLAEPSP